jgi:hypothetical protein
LPRGGREGNDRLSKVGVGIHRQIELLKMLLDMIAKYPNGPLDLKVWCCEKRLATLP